MISDIEIDNRFIAMRFYLWTTDWTLPWLFKALLDLDPAVAWISSFAVTITAGVDKNS